MEVVYILYNNQFYPNKNLFIKILQFIIKISLSYRSVDIKTGFTLDVIQDKFGRVMVLTKLPLIIRRISTVSGVKARM